MMMTQFRKQLLAGVAAIGLLAGSLGVHAAGAPNPEAPPTAGREAWSPEKMQERYAKHQAELHSKLQLTPGQEQAWNSFSDKMKPGPRPARPDRAATEKLTAPERMEMMLARMKEGEQRFADRLAAVKEFYAILTPEQKKVFDAEFGAGRHHHHHQRRGG